MIISVLQNHSRSFFSFLSGNFIDFTHEKAPNRCFFPVFAEPIEAIWAGIPVVFTNFTLV